MSENSGKFQAIRIDGTSVLIIDTQEGHLWLWGVYKDIGFALFYQGQVSVGEKPGDTIYQFPNGEAKT